MSILKQLWNDEAGVIISAELVLIATVLVLGMLVGLVTVRDAVVQELGDIAVAIGAINQSFSFSAIRGHHSSTAGSVFVDLSDSCDNSAAGAPDTLNLPPGCIAICDADSAATQEQN